MSIFKPVHLECPSCGEGVAFQAVASVNAGRAPALRAAILAETFQRETCAACGTSFRLAPRFSLIDHARRLWIAVLPVDRRSAWPEEEVAALAAFERAYGAGASPGIRRIGATLRRRLVFGWSGVREKLLADELGIDDLTLELVKLAVLGSVDAAPIGGDAELRLLGGDATRLGFAWQNADDENPIERLEVPRDVCDEVGGEAWAELRAELGTSLYVDIGRLTVATTPA